jgi:uncharacterized protein YjiS (DUF1127 family)
MHTPTISLRPSLATQAQRALQAAGRRLGGVCRRWQQARRAHATASALRHLDDRVLHDLGLSRSELLSAAAELHGLAERHRRVTRPSPRQPR